MRSNNKLGQTNGVNRGKKIDTSSSVAATVRVQDTLKCKSTGHPRIQEYRTPLQEVEQMLIS